MLHGRKGLEMPRDMRSMWQSATLRENLEESNVHWDRTETMLWWYRIIPCSACYKRKGRLINHRREAHGLNIYQVNIPDQQLPPEGKIFIR